jgi:ABC-type uncharacterized transport system substrate-binding protein
MRTIPIVFATAGHPVAGGIVPRFDRLSGNITGFATNEGSLRGKWLELLAARAQAGHNGLRPRDFYALL